MNKRKETATKLNPTKRKERVYTVEELLKIGKERNIMDFVKETGLKVEECSPKANNCDFKSWKVALYLCNRDYHMFIEDFADYWTAKRGFTPSTDKINFLTPIFTRGNDKDNPVYEYFGTYKLTNPRADENNEFLK